MDTHKNGIRGKPSDSRGAKEQPDSRGAKGAPDSPGAKGAAISAELQAVAEWLSKVRFRRQWIGGVDERSVWNRIKELNQLYEEALRAERIRYDSLLEEYRKRYGPAEEDQGVDVLTQGSHGRPPESG